AELHRGVAAVGPLEGRLEDAAVGLGGADRAPLLGVDEGEVDPRLLVGGVGLDGLLEEPAALLHGVGDLLEAAVEEAARRAPVEGRAVTGREPIAIGPVAAGHDAVHEAPSL